MKHTLKSLLITSILTLPTVFGAGDSIDVQDSGAQHKGPKTSLLKRIDPVQLYSFVGERIIDRNSVTATDDQNGFNVSSEGVLRFVHNREMYNVTGVNQGFFNLRDIGVMASVSKAWYGVCKDMLSLCKTWVNARLLRQLPAVRDTTHSLDTQMMKLFVIGLVRMENFRNADGGITIITQADPIELREASPFEIAFQLLLNKRIIKVVSGQTLDQLNTLFSERPRFNNTQSNVLLGLQPDATPENMAAAAKKVYHFASLYNRASTERHKYNLYAAELIAKAAKRGIVSINDITEAARTYLDFSNANYHQQIAELSEIIANHAQAHSINIQVAAYNFTLLAEESTQRKEFHKKAAELFSRAANHITASRYDIDQSANRLLKLGNLYPEGSAERLNFHQQATQIYEMSAKHNDATH